MGKDSDIDSIRPMLIDTSIIDAVTAGKSQAISGYIVRV
jgi:hypothetical protein